MFCNAPAIRAEGIGKTYVIYERPLDRLRQLVFGRQRQYGRAFAALADVSFTLPKGQVLGIVGNNGAGKSTLLQLVCRTLTPTAGSLEVNGRVAALLELGAGFNPDFSGRENIFLNAAVLGLSTGEIEARYDSIVEFSGIAEFIDQPVKTYSSGMYVRLAFAIATSVEPDILVIDEALSVGDGGFARKSFDRIMSLKERGATILFCSHSMYHIEAICDRALWLERGRMRLLDTPDVVTREYAAHLLPPEARRADPATGDTPPAVTPQGAAAKLIAVEASADGVSGNHLQLRPGVSSLRINVRFRFDPDDPLPSIAFGIDTATGVAVSSGSTAFDGASARIIAPGTGEVSLCFPEIRLMRGKYRLSIYLACERTIHLYDAAPYCIDLEVLHDGKEQGVCFLSRAWNDGEVRHVV